MIVSYRVINNGEWSKDKGWSIDLGYLMNFILIIKLVIGIMLGVKGWLIDRFCQFCRRCSLFRLLKAIMWYCCTLSLEIE